MVRFTLKEDWKKAMFEGPWLALGSYMLVQAWEPGLDMEKEVTHMTVWVRFPDLPIYCYDQKMLKVLASEVGEFIKTDINTSEVRRGKFARVAIKIDLTKSLVDRFLLNDMWCRVEYESLNLLCLNCGRVGHIKIECGQGNEGGHNQRAETGEPSKMGREEKWAAVKAGVSSDPFGEWMQVLPRKRNQATKPKVINRVIQDVASKRGSQGSRFAQLETQDVEEVQEGRAIEEKEATGGKIKFGKKQKEEAVRGKEWRRTEDKGISQGLASSSDQ